MPEIMGFDQDCLIPNESFGEDLSPLQRKINLEGDLSVTDLNWNIKSLIIYACKFE